MKRSVVFALAVVLVVAAGVPVAGAAPGARVFEFVGTAAQCAPGPAGATIVTSEWIPGIGLPDNLGSNVFDPGTGTPNKRDQRQGLLLSKNGSISDCSSAGAHIVNFVPITVTTDSTIGFDIRNGSWCGAGAPRFNVYVNGAFHGFLGCFHGDKTPAPQDPGAWTRVRFNLNQDYPGFTAIPVGDAVTRLDIVHDEGTDVTGHGMPGLAVIDNIQAAPGLLIPNRGYAIPE